MPARKNLASRAALFRKALRAELRLMRAVRALTLAVSPRGLDGLSYALESMAADCDGQSTRKYSDADLVGILDELLKERSPMEAGIGVKTVKFLEPFSGVKVDTQYYKADGRTPLEDPIGHELPVQFAAGDTLECVVYPDERDKKYSLEIDGWGDYGSVFVHGIPERTLEVK